MDMKLINLNTSVKALQKISLVILLGVSFFSSFSVCMAQVHKPSKHRHHEAHVHGSAKLSIGFDGLSGKVIFEAAAQGIIGFEHKAKTDLEKKQAEDRLKELVSIFPSMIVFDSNLSCQFKQEKIEQIFEKTNESEVKNKKEPRHGEHSEISATFFVNCQKAILGSKLRLDFTKMKNLNDIDVTVLVGDLQKSVELKRTPITIDLK